MPCDMRDDYLRQEKQEDIADVIPFPCHERNDEAQQRIDDSGESDGRCADEDRRHGDGYDESDE